MRKLIVGAANKSYLKKRDAEEESCERIHHPSLGYSPWFSRCPTFEQFEIRLRSWHPGVHVVRNGNIAEVWFRGELIYSRPMFDGTPQ